MGAKNYGGVLTNGFEGTGGGSGLENNWGLY